MLISFSTVYSLEESRLEEIGKIVTNIKTVKEDWSKALHKKKSGKRIKVRKYKIKESRENKQESEKIIDTRAKLLNKKRTKKSYKKR